MKNYLDLQAINYKLNVCIELTPVGTPDVVVKVADNIHADSKLLNPLKLEYQLGLLDLFSIEIELKNKIYSTDSETAVIVQQIFVDSIKIVPKFVQLAEYTNDHDYIDPTNYLGFNGKWILTFNKPFYQWIHQNTGQGLLVDH
jgi:hypothetical protein